MNKFNLLFIFQDLSTFLEKFGEFQNYIILIGGFLIAFVYFRTGLSDKIAAGWERLSGMQDKELALGKTETKFLQEQKVKDDSEINKLTLQIVDLTREVDVRREINRQDSEIIKGLKLEIINNEETISRLRSEIRNINNTI